MERIALITLIFLSSCVTFQKCYDKYGEQRQDTVITYIDRVVPADVIHDTIHINTIQLDTVYSVKQGRATVKYEVRDSIILLEAVCDTVFVRDTIYQEVTVNDFKPPENKIKNSIDSASIFIVLLIVLVLIVKFVKNRQFS